MKMKITCETCGEQMGQAEKEEFSDQDIQTLQAQVNCSSGHGTTVLIEETE